MFHPELKWQNNFQIKFLFLSVVSRKSVLSLIKFYPNLILLTQDDKKHFCQFHQKFESFFMDFISWD